MQCQMKPINFHFILISHSRIGIDFNNSDMISQKLQLISLQTHLPEWNLVLMKCVTLFFATVHRATNTVL